MISNRKTSRKRRKKQKSKLDITIDQVLIFSAIMIITFSITMVVTFWKFQSVPDALIVAFFACFGVEGGYLTYIHKLKKERQSKEIIDEQDGNDLVIDNEGEY